jgi:hypothetical protein
MVTPNILSITIAAPPQKKNIKSVYHFTHIEQKESDNSEVCRSLQNYGSSV